ncbi:ImmA/IrrE family metallo-endopeptidase [Lysinibacillus fusiformis]|nr:ImmA/IrrE family metallo-endopeptidase [Lysinibacillus fusiformis]
MGLKVFYWSDKSQALFINGLHYIFLNENQPPQQQWQDFCHELSHVLSHTGDQFHMYPYFVSTRNTRLTILCTTLVSLLLCWKHCRYIIIHTNDFASNANL